MVSYPSWTLVSVSTEKPCGLVYSVKCNQCEKEHVGALEKPPDPWGPGSRSILMVNTQTLPVVNITRILAIVIP